MIARRRARGQVDRRLALELARERQAAGWRGTAGTVTPLRMTCGRIDTVAMVTDGLQTASGEFTAAARAVGGLVEE